MNVVHETKEQLIEELVFLRKRVCELEALEKVVWQTPPNLGERAEQLFPLEAYASDAIYIIFDRKYEFVNHEFAKLFGATPEEICCSGFDPMRLVAPESWRLIEEMHRKGYRGEAVSQRYEFTGLRLDGSEINCDTLVIYIPYKWGIAIHGMLRDIGARRQMDRFLRRDAQVASGIAKASPRTFPVYQT